MAALDQSQAAAGLGLRHRLRKARGPGTGSVDDGAGTHFFLLHAAGVLVFQHRMPGIAFAAGADALGAGEDAGTAFLGIHGVQDHQARIVDPAVGIDEALAIVALQRLPARMAGKVRAFGGGQDLALGEVVVHEQAGADHPGRTLVGVVRHDEAQRPDDVRCRAQQDFAFLQGFAHQLEFVIFEVAQAAVDELGAGRGGMLGQVMLLAQQHAQAAPGRIARDARAVDAAAYHQEIIFERHSPLLRIGSVWVPGCNCIGAVAKLYWPRQ